MRILHTALTALILTCAAGPAEASVWRWRLDPERTYAFEYRSQSDITVTLPMGMGQIRDRVGIDTDFSLRVRRILPDGRFDLEIPITRMVITSESGERMTLEDFPPQVRTLRAYMTPQGRFQFYERVVVEVRDEGVYGLASVRQRGQITEGQVTAGAGDTEISATATIDPATGRVSVSAQVRERQPRTRQEEQERPVQHVDVLPADILALLELPEGAVSPGQRFEVGMPVGKLLIQAQEPRGCGERRCGVLDVRMDVDSAPMTRQVQAAAAEDSAAGDDPFGDDPFGDDPFADGPGAMPGMGGMGMPGMGAGGMGMPGMAGGSPEAAMAAAATPTMRFDIEVTALFDPDAGRMFSVSGRGGSDTDAGGMRMRETTEFRLTFAGVR
jgi:hypothetical protein